MELVCSPNNRILAAGLKITMPCAIMQQRLRRGGTTLISIVPAHYTRQRLAAGVSINCLTPYPAGAV